VSASHFSTVRVSIKAQFLPPTLREVAAPPTPIAFSMLFSALRAFPPGLPSPFVKGKTISDPSGGREEVAEKRANHQSIRRGVAEQKVPWASANGEIFRSTYILRRKSDRYIYLPVQLCFSHRTQLLRRPLLPSRVNSRSIGFVLLDDHAPDRPASPDNLVPAQQATACSFSTCSNPTCSFTTFSVRTSNSPVGRHVEMGQQAPAPSSSHDQPHSQAAQQAPRILLWALLPLLNLLSLADERLHAY